jgi:hypothetical protein
MCWKYHPTMNLTQRAAIVVFTLLCPLVWGAEPRFDVDIGIGSKGGNYCSGGLEDSKLIELGERIDNARKQTTDLDCRATGGIPLIMPDLPEPKADREVLA